MTWRTDSVSESIRTDVTTPVPGEVTDDGTALASWEDICANEDFSGRWLALDEARYDSAGRATAGLVVDVDDDLHELCMRLREADRRSCAVVFCDPARGSVVPN
jgi:hypothetical protein